ncbi:MAG: hypothetical protein RLZZ200_1110 [Pseudomonadota bacterium]|jgi:hypothetical protein
MPTINQLTRVDELSAGDLLAIFSTGNGDARAAAISVLQDYLQDNLDFSNNGDYATQYAAPAATGFNVAITDGGDNNTNVHLILTPLAGYANGTITLPAKAGLVDKQEVLVNCTQAVTTLAIGLNGATAAVGAPTTLAANAFFRLKYDAVTFNWYRVG